MGQSFSCCLGRGEKAGDAGGTWDCADLAELSAGRQTTARCRKAAAAQDVEQRVLLDNSVPTQDLPEVKAPASQDQAQAGDEGGKGKTIRFRRSESALDVAERADGFASEDVPEVMASAAQAQARAQFGETGTPCDCGCPVELSGHLGKATQVVADCVVLTRNAPSNDRPEVMACSSQAQTEAGESEGRSDCQCPIEARGCMQTTIQLRAGESAQHVAERFIKENGSPAKDLPGVVACVSQAQAAGVDPKRGLDCVCLVELSGGKQMTVRWQQGESAQDVSERTVLEHFLSMKHMPEVLARVSEAQAQIVDPSGSSDRVCLVALSGGKQMTIRWRHGETAKTVAERVLMENALPTESLSEVVACVTKAQAKAGELAGNADRVCLVELSGGSNKAVQWQQEKFAQDVAEPALQEKALRAKGLPEAVACVSQAQAQSQAQTEDPEGRFDCICPVELSGGRKMTIRWREGESVQDVAERALHDSALPTKDLLEFVACLSQAQDQTGDPAGRMDCVCPVELSGGREMAGQLRQAESAQDAAGRALTDNPLPAKGLPEGMACVSQFQAQVVDPKDGFDFRSGRNMAAPWQQGESEEDLVEAALHEKVLPTKELPESVASMSQAQAQDKTEDPAGGRAGLAVRRIDDHLMVLEGCVAFLQGHSPSQSKVAAMARKQELFAALATVAHEIDTLLRCFRGCHKNMAANFDPQSDRLPRLHSVAAVVRALLTNDAHLANSVMHHQTFSTFESAFMAAEGIIKDVAR